MSNISIRTVILRAHTQFGPTLTLVPNILLPEAHFGPRNTSAPVILRPMPTSALKYFGPQQLWPNTLRPEDQIFISVIFNNFVPSIGLWGALG